FVARGEQRRVEAVGASDHDRDRARLALPAPYALRESERVVVGAVLVERDAMRTVGQRGANARRLALHPDARVARRAAGLGAHLAPFDAPFRRNASRVVVDCRRDPGRHPASDGHDAHAQRSRQAFDARLLAGRFAAVAVPRAAAVRFEPELPPAADRRAGAAAVLRFGAAVAFFAEAASFVLAAARFAPEAARFPAEPARFAAEVPLPSAVRALFAADGARRAGAPSAAVRFVAVLPVARAAAGSPMRRRTGLAPQISSRL